MSKEHGRGQWSSNVGFIIASAGSAVGLGNLWKFPYVAGNSGGGVFVLVYLILVLLLGFTIILAEMSLGRYAKRSTVGAFGKIGEKWKIVGYLGVAAAFIILSYYGVLGGWVMEYIFEYFTGGKFGAADTIANTAQISAFFDAFRSSPIKPVIWQIIFMASTIFIVAKGISGGIEKASKLFMPALFILFIVVMIRSLTLPGAMEGVKFFLKPDFSKFSPSVVINAMGQVFYSLSLGMGINITYGSYLNKNSNLEKNSIFIPAIDTMVALIAGLTILPAVFAFGLEPTQGPGLIFVTLPTVFQSMPLGSFFGLIFFFLVFFAAITSSVALLEVVVSFAIDNLKVTRRTAVLTSGTVLTLLGIPSALSFGILQDFKLFGMSVFDFMDYVPTNFLLPIGGFLLCIAVGHVWGVDKAADEISNNGTLKFKSRKFWSFAIKYLAPLAMVIIFVNTLGIIKF